MFFLLNGFLLLQLFTGAMNSGVNAISANQGLLVYPSVKPMDPLLARFLYGLIMTMFSFSVFCVISMWMGIKLSLDSLHVVFAAYLITWACGCGFGLIFGVASAHFKELEKIIQVVQRPLLFVSAVLFPTNVLPTPTREMLMYNPLVHTIELSRHALFPYYRVLDANLIYPGAFAIVMLSIGITYFYNNRNLLSQL